MPLIVLSQFPQFDLTFTLKWLHISKFGFVTIYAASIRQSFDCETVWQPLLHEIHGNVGDPLVKGGENDGPVLRGRRTSKASAAHGKVTSCAWNLDFDFFILAKDHFCTIWFFFGEQMRGESD